MNIQLKPKPSKFKAKPFGVSAMCWTGLNSDAMLDFGNTGPQPLWGDDFKIDPKQRRVEIIDCRPAQVGDVVYREPDGCFQVCSIEKFKLRFSPKRNVRWKDAL